MSEASSAPESETTPKYSAHGLRNLIDRTRERIAGGQGTKDQSARESILQTSNQIKNEEIIKQTQRAQEAESQVITDELTGFLNSKGFNEMLVKEGSRVSRTDRSAAVVILDANGLKALNDSMGHHAGDVFLKKISVILDKTTRASDTKGFSEEDPTKVARWGGDEFGVVLTDTDLEGAYAWWARTSQAFKNEGISIGAGLQMVNPEELRGSSNDEIETVMNKIKDQADLAMLMIAKPKSKEIDEPVMVAYNSIPSSQIPTLSSGMDALKKERVAA